MTTADAKKLFGKLAKEPFEKCVPAWHEVLQLLRLPPKFIPAIEATETRRVRKQPNPAAYIRKAAVRCAVRQQVIDAPVRHSAREVLASDLSYRDLDGELLTHDERLDMATTEYERRFGSYHDGTIIGCRLTESRAYSSRTGKRTGAASRTWQG